MHLMILLGFVPQTWYRGNTKDSRSFFAFDFVTHSVYRCVNVVYSTGAKIENRIAVVKGGLCNVCLLHLKMVHNTMTFKRASIHFCMAGSNLEYDLI